MQIHDFWKDFAGPLATILAAGAAVFVTVRFGLIQARIAEAQKNIALDRLKFDVFNKRYEIYIAARTLIDYVKRNDRASSDPEWRALSLKLGEACFFFDERTQTFIREVWTVSDRMLLTRDQRQLVNSESDEKTWQALGAKLSADGARLSEMYNEMLPTFARTMALTYIGDPNANQNVPTWRESMSGPYIKTVLTVIAASLVALVIQNGVRASKADNEIQKVQICDVKSCAELAKFQIGKYGLFVVPVR